jgi:hypothetical protein
VVALQDKKHKQMQAARSIDGLHNKSLEMTADNAAFIRETLPSSWLVAASQFQR